MATTNDEYRPLFGNAQSSSSEYRPLFGSDLTDRPLFGVSNKRDRVINLIVGCITALLLIVALFSAFFAHRPPHGLNIYFAVCMCVIFLSHIVLIYWYRQGDLDPKFRILIYYNAFSMVILTTCALSYFFVEI